MDRATPLITARARHDSDGLDELFDALRTAFHKAGQVNGARACELEHRITSLQRELHDTEQLLLAAEQQAARLAGLYAAAYQLHSLDPGEVRAAIGEIAVDLLGARRCVLLLRDDAAGDYEVVNLVAEPAIGPFVGPRYGGGEPEVDAALASGAVRLTARGAVAVVPFVMQGSVIGALVVLELLAHKSELQLQDRELLDLLAAHAASALVGARVFHDAQRKLKTLEGLVALVRRGAGGPR